jgi:radical SAM protein (TIGR04043 family)
MAMTSLPLLLEAREPRAASGAAPGDVLTELQAVGARWLDPEGTGLSRIGGAGPSDHKAMTYGGQTVMVPIHTSAAKRSPFAVRPLGGGGHVLERDGVRLGAVTFPDPPRFYGGQTKDGIPYWKIAQLHSTDVLATTILQSCTRYIDRERSCQFCAIGQSLAAGRTIARKTPADLAEVAAAAVELDGVQHMVMTTGTPATSDRGARVLAECAEVVSKRVSIPIQAQCEPPADFHWFDRLRDAGVVSLGMHLEAVTEPVRHRIMPGKAEVSVATYLTAFDRAVSVFGRGQVSTYILAGLGDPAEAIVDMCRVLVEKGVYPFVVPFVPIGGTPLERHATPSPAFMRDLLKTVARVIRDGGLSREAIRAGCGRCGACSTLKVHEGAS